MVLATHSARNLGFTLACFPAHDMGAAFKWEPVVMYQPWLCVAHIQTHASLQHQDHLSIIGVSLRAKQSVGKFYNGRYVMLEWEMPRAIEMVRMGWEWFQPIKHLNRGNGGEAQEEKATPFPAGSEALGLLYISEVWSAYWSVGS